MCGIVGVAGENISAGYLLRECLRKLEYRGYDSVGIATINDGKITVAKGAGKIDEVDLRLCLQCLRGNIGIGHTRWATHGPPTDNNAHPHIDCKDRVAVVHNGIIENYLELKEELMRKSHEFKSQTDTEVIAHLIEDYLYQGLEPYEAFKKAVERLRGSYALAVLIIDTPDRIYFARRYSPLIIGVGVDIVFLASDIPAFLEYTRKVIPLNDGEIGYVSSKTIHIEDMSGRVVDIPSRILEVDWSPESARKEGYPHFMLKEIHEQPRVIGDTIFGFSKDYEAAASTLASSGNIFITAAGTSFHASLYFSLLTARLAGKKVIPFISSEYESYANLANKEDVLVAVSQSGETIDTLMALRSFKERGCKIISLTNVIGSVISRESHLPVYMKAGPEIGVAATKTFTTQLTALTWLSSLVSFYTGKIGRDELSEIKGRIMKLPDLATRTISRSEGWARRLSQVISSRHSVYYLGRGLGLPIALEGALKLKEIAYVHAEGYPAGESKHGPIALVEPGFPVVFVSIEKNLERKLVGNIEEMKARGAFTIGIFGEQSELVSRVDERIIVPSSDELLLPVLETIPLQLLAYYAAVAKGYDPDKPRNLAKTVTVE
ncbi:glucosamine--fructose-6-phosphate aminotransferase [Infirmifilum uzonense]|uniref:Glutamine--fructose-6-phosphate aminotransferase [isomerizing] n=1 Tax=Infirmifilum uzonense TaxID=1550241 RepID=A0A0F7CKS2_9CREN|nr:glutamine--fructose-6-phosphate transaminase (isomerizing) [Infirmifilum uzonense]AKG38156.1 glucosamine--fructose-6-phosphate aminotransferase [Infirmifilum uzonense]